MNREKKKMKLKEIQLKGKEFLKAAKKQAKLKDSNNIQNSINYTELD